jgi:type VI secretion system protein ImpA
MAVLDVGKLLTPISEGVPSGPNLEYDPAFAALERAAAGKAEQAIGGVVTPAEPPEYNQVFDAARALLERTKDLRIAGHLARALLFRNGVSGLAEGLELIRGLLQGFWPSLHPQLDPEDDNDPTMRITALSGLTTPALILDLRGSALVSSRALGPVSLADIAPAGSAPDTARIAGVFADVELGALEAAAQSLGAASAALQAIEAVFEAQAGSRGPDLAPLIEYFHKARVALEPRIAERQAAQAAASAEASAAASGGSAPGLSQPRGLSGDILTREDVVKALEKISQYYQRHEPSSPVPLVVERCRRLVTMSFMEILTDVAPDAVKQVQLVVGKQGDDK